MPKKDVDEYKCSFVCTNFGSEYQRGRLVNILFNLHILFLFLLGPMYLLTLIIIQICLQVPSTFSAYISSQITRNVKLHVNSCSTWYGRLSICGEYIDGVHALMDYYLIKPYHVVLLKYDGVLAF